MLYKYLFYKIYLFYINVFKEKDIPHWFAASVVSVIITGNIVLVTDILIYFLNLELNKIIGKYYGYLGLINLSVVMWYINYKKKYVGIIDTCEKLQKKEKNILRIISLLYVLIIIIGVIIIGKLLRDYNAN